MIIESIKASIIAEKLATNIRYRALGSKYNLKFQTIHQWAQEYQGKMRNRKIEKKDEIHTNAYIEGYRAKYSIVSSKTKAALVCCPKCYQFYPLFLALVVAILLMR